MRVAPATLVAQKAALKRFEEIVHPIVLTDVTHRVIERFVSARCVMVRPATVNKELRLLRAAFAKAVKRGCLTANPFAGMEMLREPEREIRILTLGEIDSLLAAAPSLRWRSMIYLALTTGMRLGEMCNLEWTDVDLANGMLTIRNKEYWQTKSRKIRRLALTEDAVGLLKQLRLASRSLLVFETVDGRPMSNNIQRDFKAVVLKAGAKHCTMHDLRRTFVSYLAMAGVNEAIVQKLAGHASMSTTLRHYTHILPESLRKAQESLPYAKTGRPMLAECGHGQKGVVMEKTA